MRFSGSFHFIIWSLFKEDQYLLPEVNYHIIKTRLIAEIKCLRIGNGREEVK